MNPTSRLDQLRKLVEADINALPDRPVQLQPTSIKDDGVSGGVSLEEPQSPPTASSKQLATASPTKTAPIPAQAMSNPDRRFVLVKDAVSSYNAGPMQTTTGLPKVSSMLPAIDLNRGDLAAAHHHFTPIQALAKYPYKFCNKINSQDIASAFFDNGKFWKREWDLYYIWDVEPTSVLILVRESQVEDLLKEINSHLKLGLKITNSQREEGFVSRFPDHPDCLPRYLGRSFSREDYDNMVHSAPNNSFRPSGESSHGPPESGTLEQFKQMMEELWEVQKNKNKAKKAKQQQERIGKQISMVDQFKRAQRYLGLRASETIGQTAPFGSLQAIDPSLPAPFAFEKSVVIVCVDVESYERAHHKVTEIGIATLDTRDLVGIAPGEDGIDWRKKIKARHFRIKENRHLINHEFVAGHPEGFEFGESTFIDLKEAPTHVAACFRPPFGTHVSNTPEDEISNTLCDLDLDEDRNIVFVAHDTLSDVRYLQQLGYDPMKVKTIIEAMDTAKIYQAWRRDSQPTSLGRILVDFDIIGWKLHNAGNDAMYTVQAMLAICIREATIRGSAELETMRDEDKNARLAAAHEAAAQRAKEDAEGWSDNEAAGDGGAPVPLVAL